MSKPTTHWEAQRLPPENVARVLALLFGPETAAAPDVIPPSYGLDAAFDRIAWIVLAIVALVAALVLLVMNWGNLVAWISEVWSGFVTWVTGITDAMVQLWEEMWAELAAMLADLERLEHRARQWLELDDAADLNDDAAMVAALPKQEASLERAMARAKGRLENASAAMRQEVAEPPEVRVFVSHIVAGRPESLAIHGVLEPLMFLPADAAQRKPAKQEGRY